MIESDALRTRLLEDPAVCVLVGSDRKARVYPIVLPQDSTFPALTYQLISAPRELTHDGPSGVAWNRIQIDCWASTYLEAKQLATTVRRWLNGWRGRVGDEDVQLMQNLNSRDLYEPETRLYRVSQDWGVWADEV